MQFCEGNKETKHWTLKNSNTVFMVQFGTESLHFLRNSNNPMIKGFLISHPALKHHLVVCGKLFFLRLYTFVMTHIGFASKFWQAVVKVKSVLTLIKEFHLNYILAPLFFFLFDIIKNFLKFHAGLMSECSLCRRRGFSSMDTCHLVMSELRPSAHPKPSKQR